MKFEDVTSIDVLFVHHLPLIGGATQSLYLIMKHARAEGLSSNVLFLHNEGDAIDYFKDAGFDVLTDDKVNTYAHAYGAYRSFISRRPWVPITHMIRALLSVKVAQRLLSSLRPKVVYLNSSVLFPFAIAAKRLNIKVIWHLREQIHRGNLGVRKKMFQYFFNNFSTDVISISKVNAQAISLRRKRIHVIYNSVDLSVFNPSIDNSDFKRTFNIERELVVTFLGGNLKSKGAILFVEAAIIVLQKYDNIRFIIAGHFNANRETQFNRIEKKIFHHLGRNVKLRNSLIFIGVVENVAPILASSYLLVWPATVPHFARPVMEAMVMGIPVVASNYESTAEIIENGVDGFLVKPNRDKIAEGIMKLIEQPEIASSMGKEARKKALAIFNAEANNEVIIKLIKEALN